MLTISPLVSSDCTIGQIAHEKIGFVLNGYGTFNITKSHGFNPLSDFLVLLISQ